MCLALKFIIVCALILSSCASPLPNAQLSEGGNVEGAQKKIAYTDEAVSNGDEHPQQIPLLSLIHHMERSLFETALSVSSLAHDKDALVATVTPPSHATEKRHTAPSTDHNSETSSSPSSQPLTETLLQTTERIPVKGDLPTHILIDRISVQTLNNGFPSIPLFEVKHTKLITTTVKENGSGNSTEISSTKTATPTANREMMSSSFLEEEKKAAPSSDLSKESTSKHSIKTIQTAQPIHSEDRVTDTTTTTTTKAPKMKLKEAEEELREKVAEIEAEPVILSARV